jgi:phosphate transport system substrate-binding protein
MNDAFLRRLRPMPRAAFVHDLKARLDRQPQRRAVVSGPAYLRTLLVALLIGGAAFAVTMMSTRRGHVESSASAPVAQVQRRSAEAVEAATTASLVEPDKDELTPVRPHAVRRDSSPVVVQFVAPAAERQPNGVSAASSAPSAEQAAQTALPSGIAAAGAAVRSLRGAGSDSLYPLISAWGTQYRSVSSVYVSYESMGSGGGLKLYEDTRVNFTALDVPLPGEQAKTSGVMQFPVVASGVVPVVHLSGMSSSQIVLDGPTLARIYLGEIAHWSDPEIRKLNPRLALPVTRITLVYRQDGSTTNYLFTDYLSGVAPAFRSRYGAQAKIDVSPGTAARGNDGMLELIERTDGAIGYLDYSYAQQNGISSIRLINREGNAVAATPKSLQSALMHADWSSAPTFGPSLTDLPGEETWPMSSAGFVVVSSQLNRLNRWPVAATMQFFDWAYRNGSKKAQELGYVTIPPAVANRVRASWAALYGGGNSPPSSERQ